MKPRADFDEHEDDRLGNIIPLCPNCHTAFDQNIIGICKKGWYFLRLERTGLIQVPAKVRLDVNDEYVQHRNEMLDTRLVYWLRKHC